VVCLDSVIQALQVSRIHAQRANCRESFVVGDLEGMPFRARSFDFIYSGGVLEHFENPRRALQEYFRVTRPSGLIIVSVPNLVGRNAAFGMKPLTALVFRGAKRGGRHVGIERNFSRRELEKVIQESGFRCLDISPTFFNTFDCLPCRPLRKLFSFIGVYRLYCRFLDALGRRFPGVAFGYSFMIALAQRPELAGEVAEFK